MEIPGWTTVLKWLGVAAVAVVVLGAPVLYHNHSVNQAYDRGVEVGKAQCQNNIITQQALQLKKQGEVLLTEQQKAQKLASKLDVSNRGFTQIIDELKQELAKTPETPSCSLSVNSTSLLRDAAGGNFDILGDAISRHQSNEMPRNATIFQHEPDDST